MDLEGLLLPVQTAERIGVTVATLGVWRFTREKPLPFVKIGARVFYRVKDVERFLASRSKLHDGLSKKNKPFRATPAATKLIRDSRKPNTRAAA